MVWRLQNFYDIGIGLLTCVILFGSYTVNSYNMVINEDLTFTPSMENVGDE